MTDQNQLYEALCDLYTRTNNMESDKQLQMADFRFVLESLEIDTTSISELDKTGRYAVSICDGRDFLLRLGMNPPENVSQSPPVRPGRAGIGMWRDEFDRIEQSTIVATAGDVVYIYAEEFKRVVYLSERNGRWSKTPIQFPLTRDIAEEIQNHLNKESQHVDSG